MTPPEVAHDYDSWRIEHNSLLRRDGHGATSDDTVWIVRLRILMGRKTESSEETNHVPWKVVVSCLQFLNVFVVLVHDHWKMVSLLSWHYS